MIKHLFLILIGVLTSVTVLAQFKADTTAILNPWTKLPNITGDKYRFAIVADVTGGERAGIFKGGLKKVNGHNPDFVVSVGDLIDGYTTDTLFISEQWDSFHQNLSVLKAPFFYVPGNHDYGNPVLAKCWNDRFRVNYYSFHVGESLFLILNPEELTDSDAGISEEQANYFVEHITAHNSGGPIFVFMHAPAWREEVYVQYKKIHEALIGKNAVVFNGHTHRNLYAVKDGIEHYSLATMAGDSRLRGVYMGEYDHYFTVDVDGDDFEIKNFTLDGNQIPTDVVTIETESFINVLFRADWVSVDPILLDSRYVPAVSSSFVLSNSLDQDLYIEPSFDLGSEFKVSPIAEKFVIPKQSSEVVHIKLSGEQLLDIEDIGPLSFDFNASYVVNGNRLQSPASVELKLDFAREISAEFSHIPVRKPHYVTESWNWSGVEDGWYDLFVKTVDENIVIKIVTHDDIVITEQEVKMLQDRIYLDFNSKRFNLDNLEIVNGSKYTTEQGINVECTLVDGGLVATVVIPYTGSDEFRVNVGFLDCDSVQNLKPSVLWWRDKTNLDFGKFRL